MDHQYNQILEGILKILSNRILAGSKYAGPINADTPLLSSGVNLDSVAVLDLIVSIENQFGVQFKDSDLSVELFRSVGTLCKAVERKLQANQP